jgi:peptide/nickel transport system permease protein
MRGFIIRRLFTSVIVLLGATMVIFALSRLLSDPKQLLLPEDAYGITQEMLDELEAQLNLDKPVPVQYAYWLWDLMRLDLGRDLADRQLIAPRLPGKIGPTVKLAAASWILATLVGIPLGVLAAVKRGTVWDYAGRIFALLGQTLPTFWVGIILILVFAVWFRLLPAGTMGEGFNLKNWVLPVVTLAWLGAAGYMRIMRSAVLEVLDSEFVKLARTKGVTNNMVIWKHAVQNAMIAPLTLSGLLLAGFITGSVSVEVVFGWPGLARYAVEAVWTNNFTVLVVVTLLFTFGFVVINFVTDILYALIDPRIRLT